ncbi:hypothetical protein BZA77DRAFT_304030 [Pyronema omphalodes]|nr:hypothetical protein BZA77DRAFT_304030 [Pyronema omphalodes]
MIPLLLLLGLTAIFIVIFLLLLCIPVIGGVIFFVFILPCLSVIGFFIAGYFLKGMIVSNQNERALRAQRHQQAILSAPPSYEDSIAVDR